MPNPYEKPDLDELMHYGLAGMKWGKRKSASESGGVIDSNQRKIASTKRLVEGKGEKRDYLRAVTKTPKSVLGLSKKSQGKRLDRLMASDARVKKGKTKVYDFLAASGDLRPIDLVVSRRDRKGD